MEENSSTEGPADCSWDLISKAVLTFGYSADPAGRSSFQLKMQEMLHHFRAHI